MKRRELITIFNKQEQTIDMLVALLLMVADQKIELCDTGNLIDEIFKEVGESLSDFNKDRLIHIQEKFDLWSELRDLGVWDNTYDEYDENPLAKTRVYDQNGDWETPGCR